MSQVAAKRKLVLEDRRVRVRGRFREAGSVLAGTAAGGCEGFEIEVSIKSEEPEAAIAELVALAHRMCFTEDALRGRVALARRDLHNGRPIAVL